MRRARRAKTLLELIVVVAIIVILLGLLAPCYVQAIGYARRTVGRAQGSR